VSQAMFVAEIGVNHDGDPVRAARMVAAAADAGFDAVKFQYWNVEELLAAEVPNASYAGPGDQRDLLAGLRLDIAALSSLRRQARELGVRFIVTPDGERACQEVLTLAPDAIKVGSGDADNPWLLEAVAACGLPAIVSTGMMDVQGVVELGGRLSGVADLTLLHCVSAYPVALEEARLFRIEVLRRATGRPAGLSDHSLGIAAASAALALGAVVVEKHVTWDTAAVGPDHAMSLHLDTAAEWVETLRRLEVGLAADASSAVEDENRVVVRKALYLAADVAAGEPLTLSHLVPLRPLSLGIPAGARDAVLGRRLRRAGRRGDRLNWDDLVPDG
jgi:N,N'-diacetyllegionaminate synthase